MARIIVLDTGVLGQLVRPAVNRAITEWMRRLVQSCRLFCQPEIADYELRRELLHMGFEPSLAELDRLGGLLRYLPLTTAAPGGGALGRGEEKRDAHRGSAGAGW